MPNSPLVSRSAAVALLAVAVAACASNAGGGGGDTSSNGDAGVDTNCAEDGSILTPADAATDPSAAACQACLADPSSVVSPDGESCLSAAEACDADCTCRTSVLRIGACVTGGGASTTCFASVAVTTPALETDVAFAQLIACQTGACATTCGALTSTADAGEAGLSGALDSGGATPADGSIVSSDAASQSD